MLDNIKNSDLVITPTYIKNDILKETSEKKDLSDMNLDKTDFRPILPGWAE